MENSILDAIYYEYSERDIEFIKRESAKSEEAFMAKYILPLIEEDTDKGLEMEEMFSDAVNDLSQTNFKNGFRLGVRLMKECLDNDLQKNNED